MTSPRPLIPLSRTGPVAGWFAQYALDGEWEQARAIPQTPQTGENEDDPPLWLDAIGAGDVAVEIVLTGPTGLPNAFLGVRWTETTAEAVRHALGTVNRCLRFLEEHGQLDLTAFERESDGSSLFSAHVSSLEVGVFNQWRAAGSLTIWHRGQPYPSAREVLAALKTSAPHLLQSQAHAVALEAVYEAPRPHWLGWVISRPDGGGHRISHDTLTTVLTHNDTYP